MKCHSAKPQRGDINIQTYDILMEWTGRDNLGWTILLFITAPPSVRHMHTQTLALASRCVCTRVCMCTRVCVCLIIPCRGAYRREMMDRCQRQVSLPFSSPVFCVCVCVTLCVIDRCECRGLGVCVQTPLNTCSLA